MEQKLFGVAQNAMAMVAHNDAGINDHSFFAWAFVCDSHSTTLVNSDQHSSTKEDKKTKEPLELGALRSIFPKTLEKIRMGDHAGFCKRVPRNPNRNAFGSDVTNTLKRRTDDEKHQSQLSH
jgi:hypothetical protein